MAKKLKEPEQLIMDGVKPPKIVKNAEEQQVKPAESPSEPDPNQVSIDEFVEGSILQTETVKKLMAEAAETEKETKKKKSAITSTIFFIINLALMIFIVKNLVGSAGDIGLKEVFMLQGKRMWWLAAGVGLLLIWFIVEIATINLYLRKTSGKGNVWLSYRLASVGKYYDFITPTQLGGQPSQILRLTKSGVGAGIATSIPIIKLIVYNFVYTVVAILLYFFAVPLIPVSGSFQGLLMAFIRIVGAIGLIVTVISCFLYLIIGNGKIIGRSFVQRIVRLGFKLHIVKNYRKAFDKLLTQVNEYQSSIKYLNRHKGTLAVAVIYGLIQCIAFGLIPFCVTMAFGNFDISSFGQAITAMLVNMASYYMCLMVSTVIPLPGGTGSMEICYIFLFSIGIYCVPGATIGWALIMFRIITYYSVLAHGFMHIVFENISRAVKAKRKPKLAKAASN